MKSSHRSQLPIKLSLIQIIPKSIKKKKEKERRKYQQTFDFQSSCGEKRILFIRLELTDHNPMSSK